ncbi:MAG: ABC transporter ATP-binding protein [Acidimicrobiia bacterium]|nr:MAG: ABC transporter ATP-binding protein [Acidimicrobiia bacterium]
MGAEPVLAVEGLRVTFPAPGGAAVRAVDGLDLAVAAGETVGIVGESGSGKSAAMLAVMGLLPGRARVGGSVRFRGEELLGRPEKELRRLRGGKLAMVFQDPGSSLNPVLTVGRQIAEAVRAHQGGSRGDARRRAVELLAAVGVPSPATAVDRHPHELSGGMRQRVLIATAVANDPEVLILDEATTALDVTVQAQVLELVASIQARTGCAVLLVSHDLGVVAGLADRVAVVYAGRVVEHGPVDDVLGAPVHPYTRALLDCLPRATAGPRVRLTPIAGQPPSPAALPAGCPFHPRCPAAVTGPGGPCDARVPAPVAVAPGHEAACHFVAPASRDRRGAGAAP